MVSKFAILLRNCLKSPCEKKVNFWVFTNHPAVHNVRFNRVGLDILNVRYIVIREGFLKKSELGFTGPKPVKSARKK